jgi:hypothetical protein
MPWHTSGKFAFSPINVTSKKPYRGVNTLCLWAAAQSKGYEGGEFPAGAGGGVLRRLRLEYTAINGQRMLSGLSVEPRSAPKANPFTAALSGFQPRRAHGRRGISVWRDFVRSVRAHLKLGP